MNRVRRTAAAAAAVLVAITLFLSGCTAPRLDPVSGADAGVLETFKGRGMVDHLEALQRVADASGGNRASGTSGYEESARLCSPVSDSLRVNHRVRLPLSLPATAQSCCPTAPGSSQPNAQRGNDG